MLQLKMKANLRFLWCSFPGKSQGNVMVGNVDYKRIFDELSRKLLLRFYVYIYCDFILILQLESVSMSLGTDIFEILIIFYHSFSSIL